MQEKQFNDFKEYKDTKIPEGKSVIFELLNIKDDELNKGRKIIPLSFVPAKDVIIVNGEVKEIAAIVSLGPNGTYTLDQEIAFSPQSGGRLVLTSGNIQDEIRYPYLVHSNYNDSNKNRDKKKTPIYRLVEPEKEAAEKLAEEELLIEAKGLIRVLRDSEIKDAAKALGITDDTVTVLKRALYSAADVNPEKLIKTINGLGKKEVTSTELDTGNIFRKKILTDSKTEFTVTFNGEIIYDYSSEKVLDKQKLFEYLKENKPDIWEQIIKALTA